MYFLAPVPWLDRDVICNLLWFTSSVFQNMLWNIFCLWHCMFGFKDLCWYNYGLKWPDFLFFTHLTNSLTPLSSLFGNVIVRLKKSWKCPVTLKLITMFTRPSHLFVHGARLMQYTFSNPFSFTSHFNIIHPTVPRYCFNEPVL